MKLISRNTDYAVRAVCYIARQKDRLVTAGELVKHLNIPRPFLRKILQVLNKENILRSHKGSGGGFGLARKPGSIYLMELIEVFQGPFKLNECFLKKQICPDRKSCCLKKKIDSIEDMVHSELKGITIGSIMKPFDPSAGSGSILSLSKDDKSSGFHPERSRGIKRS